MSAWGRCRYAVMVLAISAGLLTTASAYSGSDTDDSSSSAKCGSGTTDLGMHEGHSAGKRLKIRLCAVKNLPSSGAESNSGNRYSVKGASGLAVVNATVSDKVYRMVAAAKRNGVVLKANSSYRTYKHQVVEKSRDDSAAEPGHSNHEMGLAIDFSLGPGVLSWLHKHAADYGFHNAVADRWHWSPSGH